MSKPQGGIVRTVRRSGEFFTAPKGAMNDFRLSFGARGILAYIFSKPNDWVLRNDDLYRQSPAGRTAIDRMLKELKTYFYLHREKKQVEPGGDLVWVTTVYEFPEDHPEWPGGEKDKGDDYPKAQNPTVGKPDVRETRQSGSPTVGKPDDILINDSTNNININTRTCASAQPKLDPLSHAFNLQVTHDPQASEPSDFEMYFGSRDEFINIYYQQVGSYPNQVVKDEIIRIAQLPGASPAAWKRAIRETFLNYTGQSPPPIRFIEVYEHGGGDYKKFAEWKIKNGDWQDTSGNGGKNGQARTGKGKSRPNGKAGGSQGATSLTDSYLANNADNIARKLDALHRS